MEPPYSVRMLKNAGKMRTRIPPNTDTFYAVYIIPGLVPTGFRCRRVSSDLLLESTSFL